jgi:hypothetical protein
MTRALRIGGLATATCKPEGAIALFIESYVAELNQQFPMPLGHSSSELRQPRHRAYSQLEPEAVELINKVAVEPDGGPDGQFRNGQDIFAKKDGG